MSLTAQGNKEEAGKETENSRPPRIAEVRQLRTRTSANVCASDCYGACRMQVSVKNGRIVQITGDPRDPYTQGALCAKGYGYLDRVYSAERITSPMKQEAKGSGQWVRLSWRQALTEIAERLIRIRDEEQSMLPVCLDKYLGSLGILNRAVEGFFRSIGPITVMSGSPCEPAGFDALRLSYGACKKSWPEDMANANVIIIWGANPAWTAPHQMRHVFEARERGARLVVIDPVLTATAARSDYYVQIRPGADGLLALGMAKVIVQRGLIDHEFVDVFTHGFEAFRALLESIDLTDVAATTGVPVAEVVRLATLYAGAKPAAIWLGIGAQHAQTGGQNYRAIDALAALTGNIGRSGGNVHYVTNEAWAFSGAFDRLAAPDGSTMAGHRTVGPGRHSELQTMSPAVRLLWVAGRNPVSQNPDAHQVEKVLRSTETVVVADQFMTATAALADYFLPVASFFEYEDVVVSHWHYGAAVNERAIDPLGESRSDLEIMRELASILDDIRPGFSSFPTARTAAEWLDAEMNEHLYPLLGISHYRDLLSGYYRVRLPRVAWADRQFPTHSGRYEFYSHEALANGLPPLPVLEGAVTASEAYPFQLVGVRSFSAINSQFRENPRLAGIDPGGRLFIHPVTAQAKGIGEDDLVHVYNRLGECPLRATLTAVVQPDLLMVYVGDTASNGDPLNSLVPLGESDLGQVTSGFRGLSFGPTQVNFMKKDGR